jgi:Rrf2 family protein
MLKISNRERYAVCALFDLAFHIEGQPSQSRDVAARQRIPIRFLEQIFHDLKRAGLVASKRGPGGGYQLARRPAEISLGDVLRALHGGLSVPPSPASEARRVGRPARSPQPEWRNVTDGVLEQVARDVERCFDRVTLEDLCAHGEGLGLVRSGRPGSAYAI